MTRSAQPTPAATPPTPATASSDPAELTRRLLESYESDDRIRHVDAMFLPSRDHCIQIVELLRRLTFPGFFEDQRLTTDNIADRTLRLVRDLDRCLFEQIRQTERYLLDQRGQVKAGDDCPECDRLARQKTDAFLAELPEVRRKLSLDVQAAFDGDPAATSTDETIFCYPGLDAIFIHRYAHELYRLQLPLLARIFSEYAHNETGIEIHPGAQIGESFFIDHGTGIVIGETVTIGHRVKIYQGVTLGALSTKGGQDWRGLKRHPTIEDDVTIYGGAIILGGTTVVGAGATIGGSVFLTKSVPAGYSVTMKPPELTSKPPRQRKNKA